MPHASCGTNNKQALTRKKQKNKPNATATHFIALVSIW